MNLPVEAVPLVPVPLGESPLPEGFVLLEELAEGLLEELDEGLLEELDDGLAEELPEAELEELFPEGFELLEGAEDEEPFDGLEVSEELSADELSGVSSFTEEEPFEPSEELSKTLFVDELFDETSDPPCSMSEKSRRCILLSQPDNKTAEAAMTAMSLFFLNFIVNSPFKKAVLKLKTARSPTYCRQNGLSAVVCFIPL